MFASLTDLPQIRLVLVEGNVRHVRFTLDKAGTRSRFPIPDSAQMRLEWENEQGVSQPPILADRNHPLANWPQGVVVFVLDNTNILARNATYPIALTIADGGEVITLATGTMQVTERPGWPL